MFSCKNESISDLIETNTSINLKFNAYPTSTNNDARIGLEWALSQIGAKNTAITFNGIIQNNNIFILEIEKLGFNENAKTQLKKLHRKIKGSQEYKINNTLDLGRYVTLIIGASEHYFKITGVPENLENILVNYQLKNDKGYVNNSVISLKDRIVEFSAQNDLNQLFVTQEIEPSTGEILEFETIEIMENGQLKFGIFNADGERKNAATPSISTAGKPAKCMWCHESNINRLFTVQDNFNGFLPYLQLNDTLVKYNNQLKEKQFDLLNGVNFRRTQDHVKMELLYISFMEPSAEFLSKEWNLPLTEVHNRLQDLETHQHPEFNFLGNLYYRNEVKQFAPFTSLQVSSNVREQSQVEVNHID